jgi:hypothetical protein
MFGLPNRSFDERFEFRNLAVILVNEYVNFDSASVAAG